MYTLQLERNTPLTFENLSDLYWHLEKVRPGRAQFSITENNLTAFFYMYELSDGSTYIISPSTGWDKLIRSLPNFISYVSVTLVGLRS